MQLWTAKDMSFTAHHGVASFLAAAHKTMLEWLKEAQRNNGYEIDGLREWWYNTMERSAQYEEWKRFFSEVLREANSVSH